LYDRKHRVQSPGALSNQLPLLRSKLPALKTLHLLFGRDPGILYERISLSFRGCGISTLHLIGSYHAGALMKLGPTVLCELVSLTSLTLAFLDTTDLSKHTAPTFCLHMLGLDSVELHHSTISWLTGSSKSSIESMALTRLQDGSISGRNVVGIKWEIVAALIRELAQTATIRVLRIDWPNTLPGLSINHWFLLGCHDLKVLSIQSRWITKDDLEAILRHGDAERSIKVLELVEPERAPQFIEDIDGVFGRLEKVSLKKLVLFKPDLARPSESNLWDELSSICRRYFVEFAWNPIREWPYLRGKT
jgi:hypothetical protein